MAPLLPTTNHGPIGAVAFCACSIVPHSTGHCVAEIYIIISNFQCNCAKMKDVIDVLQLQREKSRQVPAIDYTETENSFIAVRYIFECGKDRNYYL